MYAVIAILAAGLMATPAVGQMQPAPSVAVTTAAAFTLYAHNRSAKAIDAGETSPSAPTTAVATVPTLPANSQVEVAAAMDAFSRPTPAPGVSTPSPGGCTGLDAVPWRPGLSDDTHVRRRIWWPTVRAAECRYQIPPGLFDSMVIAESRYRAAAVSRAGAGGLSQLMPKTAANVGVANRFDAAANADGGARYLRQLLDRFRSVPLAVAAYNAGPAAVIRAGGVPANGETPDYVRAVLTGWSALGQASTTATIDASHQPRSVAELLDFGN